MTGSCGCFDGQVRVVFEELLLMGRLNWRLFHYWPEIPGLGFDRTFIQPFSIPSLAFLCRRLFLFRFLRLPASFTTCLFAQLLSFS